MTLFQSWREINWCDQALHALAGFTLVVCIGVYLPWWAAVLISMAIAVGREQWQHPGVCHAGCRTDLLCWTLGSLIGLGIGFFF